VITDLGKQRQQFYTDATTVGEALRQTAVRIPPNSVIVPAEDTPFTAGNDYPDTRKDSVCLVSKGDEIPLTGTEQMPANCLLLRDILCKGWISAFRPKISSSCGSLYKSDSCGRGSDSQSGDDPE
jgi:uncharacterized protein YabE (DUF348 family)